MGNMTTYLFSYTCLGIDYVIEVEAKTQLQARHRLSCMAMAKYDGEQVQTIWVGWRESIAKWLGL